MEVEHGHDFEREEECSLCGCPIFNGGGYVYPSDGDWCGCSEDERWAASYNDLMSVTVDWYSM